MPPQDRAEQSVRKSPGTVRVEDLVSVLRAHGFDCRRTGNGHWVCFHPQRKARTQFAEPHGKGDSFVKQPYVRKALRAIDAVVAAEADEEEQP